MREADEVKHPRNPDLTAADRRPQGLRVAHVLRKYDPEEWGGTETHVVAVTNRLAAEGWAAEVHAPAGPRAPDGALAPGVHLRRYRAFSPFVGDRVQRRALWANAGNIVSFDEAIRLARDPGLTLAHAHTLGRIGGAVRTAMRLTRRPYVVSVHGPLLGEREIVAENAARWLHGLWDLGRPIGLLLGARRVLDDAARVLTFNDVEHAALAARIGARAVRVDHGVDATRLASGDPARARRRWPELGEAPVIALVGRVASQKNQVLAVRAFALGAPPDHRLALAGAETEPGYGARVEHEARAFGVADRVHLLGNVDPDAGVPDLLARAAIVLVPSVHETFGLSVLEGWAASRPVIFARRGGLVDLARVLRDDATSVATLDPREWAERIRLFATSARAREEATAAGAELLRDRFHWGAIVRRLAAIYREVLEERTATRRP
jgi:glycosyltransferase involved in cell wall biosynthesis